MAQITIVYAQPDEKTALRLAEDLTEKGYNFGELSPDSILVAVVSPEGLQDDNLREMLVRALDMNLPIIPVETEPTTLPDLIDHLEPVSFQDGYKLRNVTMAIERAIDPDAPPPKRVLTPALRDRNRRIGLIFGGLLVLLFLGYIVAIALFDIEAPQEEFQRLYTRDAATINAFAQEYIPRSTEQAAEFEATLADFPNEDLATVVVQTATQAAAEGGFTPLPTGQIIAEPELSEARQTATGGAILRATETAEAGLSEANIMATATAAAATANAELDQQQMTVTAAAAE
jgi:hypothetical protein